MTGAGNPLGCFFVKQIKVITVSFTVENDDPLKDYHVPLQTAHQISSKNTSKEILHYFANDFPVSSDTLW